MLLVVAILLAVFVLDEPWTWVAVLARRHVELVETTLIVRWSKRRRVVVGRRGAGRAAARSSPPSAGPIGQVRIVGELWQARCDRRRRRRGRKWSSRLSMA